jgi:hypothetical protein
MRFIRKIIHVPENAGDGIGVSNIVPVHAALAALAALFLGSGCSGGEEKAKQFPSLIFTELRSDVEYNLRLTEPQPPAAEPDAGTPAGPPEGRAFAGETPPAEVPREPEYRSMQRFEAPSQTEKHISLRIQAPAMEEGETVAARDKKLIFGGKGFETREFESYSKEKMNINYHTYVYSPLEEPAIFRRPPDHLDLAENRWRDNRPVIFHPAGANFNQQDIEIETASSPTENARTKPGKVLLEPIAETKILLRDKPKDLLRLRKVKEPMDLLMGNETVNANRFQGWERSTPKPRP